MVQYSIEPKTRKCVKHWQNCKTKTCIWWESKKCWRNNYSAGQERRNIKQINTIIIKMEHHRIS